MNVTEKLFEKIPLIEVKNLSKSYEDVKVLDSLSFSVRSGEIVAIIGPSGSGKSTILKVLSGLEKDYQGRFFLGDDNIGVAFQYSALLNSYTVGENVAFAFYHSGLSKNQIREKVYEKLYIVGMEDFYSAMPYELSGGQQKRVSFARAIANNPKIVLYDEPTAGLDPINSTIIEDHIVKLRDISGAASIVVTHQHSTIRRTADRVICLHKGKFVWQGCVSELDTDQNAYIRQFIDGKTEGPFLSV